MPISVLNIAGGKIKPFGIEQEKEYFLVNCDTMYYNVDDPTYVEDQYKRWLTRTTDYMKSDNIQIYKIKTDIFEFMERTTIMFDEIACYRFLEHIPRDKLLYFIYLMANCLKEGGKLDIIVPNYNILAHRLINSSILTIGTPEWEQNEIIITTEILNEKFDPHCSIWTPDRINYYFEFENRFKVEKVCSKFEFDGRDVYLNADIRRI